MLQQANGVARRLGLIDGGSTPRRPSQPPLGLPLAMSGRTKRLDELMREEISEVIRREVDDPRIGFVTITSVEVASDLRHANVWVSIIGTTEEKKLTLRALSRAMPFVRQRLGRLRLKRIPELHVKEDQTAERGTRLLRILDELEQGGTADLDRETETLPTPTAVTAREQATGDSSPDTEKAEI